MEKKKNTQNKMKKPDNVQTNHPQETGSASNSATEIMEVVDSLC